MSASSSSKVIIIALLSNIGIAISKIIGALISGSASLFAEAIHSLVDCSNQILLLIGNRKSQKPADAIHPLGYAREAFFWSFMVAILLFSLGGLFAIYEGIHKLQAHEAISSPALGIGILILSCLLEGYSFWTCYKEVKRQNIYGSLIAWFQRTSNSELLVIFTEDAAALSGLFIATTFLSIAWVTGNSYWDAIGSILVGILLVIVGILLAIEIKSFIIGEAPSDNLKNFVIKTVPVFFPSGRVFNIIAIQTGSNEMMMICKIHPGLIKDVDIAISLVNQLEKLVKNKFPELRWQFIEFDNED